MNQNYDLTFNNQEKILVIAKGDCLVIYEQCAKPINGKGPLKMFTRFGCRKQRGPNAGILVFYCF